MPTRKTKPKRPRPPKSAPWAPMDPKLYGKWAAWVPGTDQLIVWAETYEELHEKASAKGLAMGEYAIEFVEGPQAGYLAPPNEET